MDANFELWEKGERDVTKDRVHVTLSKYCKLYFNALALESLGDPDGVALLFDARKKIIGVMPATLNKNHTYRLRHKSRGMKGCVITVRNFCDHHKIRPSETLAFPTAAINRDGIMTLDLHSSVTARP